jgi:hypothetical protein
LVTVVLGQVLEIKPNMKKQKRIKATVGDLVKIQLDSQWHVYARVLKEPLFAFYDSRTDKELTFDEIKNLPVLFKIWVMKYAVTSGRWPVVGNYHLEESLKQVEKFFKQDCLNPQSISIYYEGHEIPATREECIGLECAAVWDPEHVEDRLRDHYAGKPNKWVKALKI